MTNREGFRFINFLVALSAPQDTKLEHARNQTLKNAAEFIERYNDKLEDLNIDFCSVNEKGHILKDQNGDRVFTKDNQRAFAREVKNFLEQEIVSQFTIVQTDDGKGLTEVQIKYLRDCGFLR